MSINEILGHLYQILNNSQYKDDIAKSAALNSAISALILMDKLGDVWKAALEPKEE